MPQVIADTYEIIRRIGSGGGGVVYLAKHLRLDKEVVVKADKRKITAKQESLRREVDALKNLSHTYIPQVYDFIQDNETVYTVMDYIDGESLDNPLKRGEKATQAQIVEWACQLLDALHYLHSRPPHGILHADIKPANIMLTPQGDIRLIDFNIALALGEDGAVSVGRSLGYASPEHLGFDFTPSGATTRNTSTRDDARATTVLDSPETVLSAAVQPSSSSSSGKKIMIDVRSDIYGLGATLYHLLTGIKPARHVKDVVPLSDKDFSYGMAAIINKAMNPNPEQRFQTAAEMLYAFEHLRENDPRTIRFKRLRNISVSICVGFLLLGAVSAFIGLKGMQAEQVVLTLQESERAEVEKIRADAEALEKEIEQAKNNANESMKSLTNGDRQKAIQLAINALPSVGSLYKLSDVPEVVFALSNALGIYDLSDGYKPYKTVTLDSEAIKGDISPNGNTAAVMSLGTLSVINTETAEIVAELPAIDSALADAIFIDDDSLVYAGVDGITAYSVPNGSKRWSGDIATTIAVSADRNVIAAVNRADDFASIYTSDGEYQTAVSFNGQRLRVVTNDRLGDPKDNLFTLNEDGSLLAVSFLDGSLRIFDLRDSEDDIELLDPSDYTHFEGGFFGSYFAFSATSASESLFAVIDMVELAETISTSLPARISVTANENGVYMSYNGTHVRIDPLTADQTPIDYDPAEIIANGYKLVSHLDSPVARILKFEEYRDTEIFNYDPEYLHDEARLSSDGNTVMLFSVDGFKLCGIDGAVITEVQLPDPGNIYDQQYRRIGGESYLEVIYYDGMVRKYSAVNGELVSEVSGESPDKSLYEEFVTDEIKITSPLHGTPIAYSLKTGEPIRELEKDAYLTYVTQSGEFIVTEYISTLDGSRYGLLLDGKTCEILAYLPNLCDVMDDRLIFDMPIGSLRETHLYSITELINLVSSE